MQQQLSNYQQDGINQIAHIIKQIFEPYEIAAHCQVIESSTQTMIYYVYVKIDHMDVIILRSLTVHELLMKVSLMHNCMKQKTFDHEDNILHQMVYFLMIQAKSQSELSVIAFEMDANYKMYLEVLAHKKEAAKSRKN